jgi:hypothetical protein
VEAAVAEDPRNNSAWVQRLWLLAAARQSPASLAAPAAAAWPPAAGAAPGGVADAAALLGGELEYAAAQVARAPRSESAWAFVQGLFTLPWLPRSLGLARCTGVHTLCAEALADCPSSAPALDTLAMFYEAAAAAAAEAADAPARAAAAAGGEAALARLRVVDPVRGRYWAHRAARLRAVAAG